MIVPIFLPHLGCGQRCAYCNQDHITNSEGESGIADRIERLLSPLDTPVEVALYGGNVLGLDPDALERLLRLFEPYREKISAFRVSARPALPDASVMALIKRYGVRTVELGIPTFNDAILAALKRGHTAGDLRAAYRVFRDEGFETGLQVMVGLPGETPGDLRETAASIADLRPAFIRIYPLLVIEDTGLARDFREGRFSPDSVESAVAKTVFLSVRAWADGIRTIKMGLTGNEVLTHKVVAGPFHPAFGYLVKSEAFCLAILRVCAASGVSGDAIIHLNPRDVPHLVGYRGVNLKRLKSAGITVARAEEDAISQGLFVIESAVGRTQGSLADALAMIPF